MLILPDLLPIYLRFIFLLLMLLMFSPIWIIPGLEMQDLLRIVMLVLMRNAPELTCGLYGITDEEEKKIIEDSLK